MFNEHKMSSSHSFAQDWGFASEIKQELKANCFDILPSSKNEKFKSGRPKFEAVFYKYNEGVKTAFTKRPAMELISKKTGQPYFMVRREDELGYSSLDASDESQFFLPAEC